MRHYTEQTGTGHDPASERTGTGEEQLLGVTSSRDRTPLVASRTHLPWTRLFAEGSVVVVSILLAFAIDAWWAARQTAAVERELLIRLEAGFATHRQLVLERISSVDQDRSLLQRFIAMTPEEAEEIAPDSVWFFFRALWRPGAGDTNAAALLATLTAGRMSVVSDQRLLTALTDWQAAITTLDQRNQISIQLEQQVQDAISHHPEVQPGLADIDGSRFLSGSVARNVRGDNEVMARAARKSFAAQIQLMWLERVVAASDEVLRLVRDNL